MWPLPTEQGSTVTGVRLSLQFIITLAEKQDEKLVQKVIWPCSLGTCSQDRPTPPVRARAMGTAAPVGVYPMLSRDVEAIWWLNTTDWTTQWLQPKQEGGRGKQVLRQLDVSSHTGVAKYAQKTHYVAYFTKRHMSINFLEESSQWRVSQRLTYKSVMGGKPFHLMYAILYYVPGVSLWGR